MRPRRLQTGSEVWTGLIHGSKRGGRQELEPASESSRHGVYDGEVSENFGTLEMFGGWVVGGWVGGLVGWCVDGCMRGWALGMLAGRGLLYSPTHPVYLVTHSACGNHPAATTQPHTYQPVKAAPSADFFKQMTTNIVPSCGNA